MNLGTINTQLIIHQTYSTNRTNLNRLMRSTQHIFKQLTKAHTLILAKVFLGHLVPMPYDPVDS